MQTIIRTPALAAEEYADWVVDLVPGAREAHDALLEAQSKASEASAVVTAKWKDLQALRETDPHSHFIEDAQRAVAEAERVHYPLTRAVVRADRDFRSTVNRGRDSQEVRQEAARRALAYHERAAAAVTELEATLEYADAAWIIAGQPGRSWRSSTSVVSADAQSQALLALRQRVNGFDVERVTEAAAGDEIPYEPALEELVLEWATGRKKRSGPIILAA